MNNQTTTTTPGHIILIHGASSAGKSTQAVAVQQQIDIPLLHISFDLFIDGRILPMERFRNGTFSWSSVRPNVMDGLHQTWKALALAGNNLIIDHIVETEAEMYKLVRLLSGMDVFFVGLHCSLEELERREIQRGNRRKGEARTDFQTVHTFTIYDLELDSELASVEENTDRLIRAWRDRKRPNAFDRIAQMDTLSK
ncbi:MAG: AAA family ATPase [Candidatus Promineifilaceae bacterium]